jgi:RimJ/RimL family protein N-acetyltransferase
MRIELIRGVDGLDPRVDGFLAERIERNVQASLLVHARAGMLSGEPLFAWGIEDGGALAFFAMRTPPWPLLVTELGEAHADALVERWLAADSGVPGVTGVPDAARAVASAWERRTGGRARRRMSDAMHVLREVIDPPRPPAGELRPAREADRGLLVDWERAFVRDAGVIAGAAAEAENIVDRRLASGAQFLWWDGAPVSTLALSPDIAGTVRIGPVFTPEEHRRRGYASAAVAAASRHALARGAHQCMLFTDLANPTSNKIYAAVGFRRLADWEELEFAA